MISPHGGRLINCLVKDGAAKELEKTAAGLPKLRLNGRELCDLEMLATGGLSPLEGFMGEADYRNVLEKMRLANGLLWSLPVVLASKQGDTRKYAKGDQLALCDEEDRALAVMEVRDCFAMDKTREAEKTLLTRDEAHPGVQYLKSIGDTYLGGPITVFRRPAHDDFPEYRQDPEETRAMFEANGWQKIVAFQTRNPIHRAHEYLQKCALEMMDGLMIHPLMGETKSGDTSAAVRMKCYLALMENYYPKDRVVLSLFPAAMRYAGPREAIFHAIARKNYGCTHFIVGRDHAGVGSYYGSFDAHRIFEQFDPRDLDISPIFFDNAFYCKKCGNMASSKTCPHGAEHHFSLSGTKVREMLAKGEMPPVEFTRPEVAAILMEEESR